MALSPDPPIAFRSWLLGHDACASAYHWVTIHEHTPKSAWATCDHAGWMLWLLEHGRVPPAQQKALMRELMPEFHQMVNLPLEPEGAVTSWLVEGDADAVAQLPAQYAVLVMSEHRLTGALAALPLQDPVRVDGARRLYLVKTHRALAEFLMSDDAWGLGLVGEYMHRALSTWSHEPRNASGLANKIRDLCPWKEISDYFKHITA